MIGKEGKRIERRTGKDIGKMDRKEDWKEVRERGREKILERWTGKRIGKKNGKED